MSTALSWSILGVWLISIVGATATIPNVVRDFRDEGIYRESENFMVEGDTIIIDLNREYRYDRFDRRRTTNDFNLISLDLEQSFTDEFKLDKRIISRGRDPRDAEHNAEMIEYALDIDESTINFDSHYTFKSGGKFRAQELDLTLYIPENVPFQIKRGMSDIMRYFHRGYDWWEIYRNTWMYTDDGLVCLSCENDER